MTSQPTAGTGQPTGDTIVVWDDALLGYDLGDHPLDPVRVELTMALARDLGVLDRPGVRIERPEPATDEHLLRVHTADYLAAIRAGSRHEHRYGLNTPDNPTFPRMHEASALVVGATRHAAEAVWQGRATRAVNVAGGLHHAMPARAAGFCVYNDPAVAIAHLLAVGGPAPGHPDEQPRIAYVDIDVHHGDGVQEIFWDDPRVLTVSLHETPVALFPGTGFATETGGEHAPGSAVNVALPPGTDDAGWLRAFHAVVPGVLRAFRPHLLVTQCGADAHRADPLADLTLTVDAQRAAYLALRELADELCDGRWVATGGGGYAVVEAVPRAWTHLLAVATGDPLDPATDIPTSWADLARARRPNDQPPQLMTDHSPARYRPWQPEAEPNAVDRAVMATRRAVYPLLGLDPHDPRD